MKQGFTLLELSIVIVIIGLIIGGITVGQGLVRSAELSSVINDVNKYKVAINTFELQYGALPGDIDEAASYWPTDCVDAANNPCNGDANGQIRGTQSSQVWPESRRGWQHLVLADLISGSYDGAIGNAILEVSVPKSKVGGGFMLSYFANIYGSAGNNALRLAGDYTTNNHIGDGVLTPEEALAIDTKADDGKPSTGVIFVGNGWSDAPGNSEYATCNDTAQGTSTKNSSLLLANSATTCRLYFWLQ